MSSNAGLLLFTKPSMEIGERPCVFQVSPGQKTIFEEEKEMLLVVFSLCEALGAQVELPARRPRRPAGREGQYWPFLEVSESMRALRILESPFGFVVIVVRSVHYAAVAVCGTPTSRGRVPCFVGCFVCITDPAR